VGQMSKQLRKMWRQRYTEVLDLIFKEFASQEIEIEPDDAMDLMEDLLREWCGDPRSGPDDTSRTPVVFRFSASAYRRDAHHYAVDRFYGTYFPRKRGAEPLPKYHLDRILALRRKGWTAVAIAKELGLRNDTAKYQVEAAEKRWHEAVEQIEELKRKYPHLVAPDLRVTGGENYPRETQSKGQNKGKHKGK